MDKNLRGIIYGLAVGDALGVPYEFCTRNEMKKNPCNKMRGYGTYNQPIGSWSDDTSMTLCLLDAINYKTKEINEKLVIENFINWKDASLFTANNYRFDIGNTTRKAIDNMKRGIFYANKNDTHNGNGALMRISPLVPLLIDVDDMDKRFLTTKNIVIMTHANEINYVGCHIYIEYMISLWNNKLDKIQSLSKTIEKLVPFYENKPEYNAFCEYHRIINEDLYSLKEYEIKSTGYIIDTLEASLYCFLHTENYKSAVLKAVNLGEDTDTIAAITGSMCGLYYGFSDIPSSWIDKLLNTDLIEDTIEKAIS